MAETNAVALLRELASSSVGEELVERAHREPLLAATSSRMLRCTSSSCGGDDAKRSRRGAVREQAVVELVRRADALPLDRLRDAVRAMREHAVHARARTSSSACACSSAAAAAVTYLTGAAGDLRLLPLPRLAAASRRARARARAPRRGTRSSGWTSSRERGWAVRHNLESAAPAALGAVAGAAVKRGARARRAATAATSPPSSRRSARRTAPTSSSRRSTPSGSR